MMKSEPSETAPSALRDISENIILAQDFVSGLTYDDFLKDRRTVYAVTRCLEIISEASRRLPDAIKKHHPSIPWGDIAGAGNIYRHAYEDVREQILWQTVPHGPDSLRTVVEEERKRHKM